MITLYVKGWAKMKVRDDSQIYSLVVPPSNIENIGRKRQFGEGNASLDKMYFGLLWEI